ncbi:P-loop containing nucleoside triphosphate hydrolase protein [Xylaria sp. FL0043]|nr:P-loop containing nucleoside triphosphate hydrolase protein [Xylaria sp. FL0043]
MAAPAAAAAAVATSATGFVPRTVFEVSPNIARSYFLGHHKVALQAMRESLSTIGLVLECRDARIPLTSRNPFLEQALGWQDRIIVYTKSDLVAGVRTKWMRELQKRRMEEFHSVSAPSLSLSQLTEVKGIGKGGRIGEGGGGGGGGGRGRTEVIFTQEHNSRMIAELLDLIKQRAAAHDSLLGLRAFVVGMPNAGKSTLLNALRREGMKLPGLARTGTEPGITRKVSMPVRIVPAAGAPKDEDDNKDNNKENNKGGRNAKREVPTGEETSGVGEGVYVLDTPGVFLPYVHDVESMLKLSLVGCVKDGIIPAETVADYLLFQLNLRNPGYYARLSRPTNDVGEFLDTIARQTGKLAKGGVPSPERAADWVVQRWRKGMLGHFMLDDISDEALGARAERLRDEAEGRVTVPVSMNQARKLQKQARKAQVAAKRAAALDSGA